MKAAAITAVMLVCAGCEESATPSAAAAPSAHDYCGEQGFVDGEKHNNAGEVIEECSLGPTPNRGAYSIARYRDGQGPTSKDEAVNVEIAEYDAAGNVIETTFGTLGRDDAASR